MSEPIIGVTVGTPINPKKLKPTATEIEEAVGKYLEKNPVEGQAPVITANPTADGTWIAVNGENLCLIPHGQNGVGIYSVERTSGTGAPGTTDTYTITYTDNRTSILTVYNGKDGATGERGTGILKVTTAPSAYTTTTGGFTPAYRIALSTVLSQSKAAKVLVGDTLAYSYYQYTIGYVDSSYAYLDARVSVRGATGKTPAKGTDYWTEADKAEIVEEATAALNGAVDAALTEAKESGEFDGEPGESAYAAAKAAGYTGTAEEFASKLAAEYVKTVNGEPPDKNGNVKVTAQAEQPGFVDSVEEMTDTTKAYVLKSTGEIWTYQSYQEEAVITPNFTNLYNKNDVEANKAYVTVNQPASASDGYYKMGLISYDFSNYDTANPVTVRIKGKFDLTHTYSRLVYFRSYDIAEEKIRVYQNFNAHIGYTTEADGTISFPLVIKKDGSTVHSEYKMFRAFSFSNWVSGSAITTDNVPDDLIITINEPITYTETPGGTFYEWRSTGMSYNAADYEPRIIALEEDVGELKTRVDNIAIGVIKEAEETIYTDFACENDFTIVGDEIWGSKNESTYTRIVRHKIVDGALTKLSEIKLADVVHLNTLDYCPENDCLITGNGANDQNTTGNCFWIIPNASNLPNLSGTLSLSDIAIQYNVDIGYKVQAIWGDGNLGQHNLVYLLSNDNEVRRAIIHKNADGSFANTYTVVGNTFTISGASGYQGADYYGGYLYFGYGGTNFVLAKVNTKDFTAEVTEYPYCTAAGAAIKGVFQGVAVDKDYIWLYPNGVSAGNYLVKYTK